VGAAPSEEQLDQLSQVIMRSQRSFKELIDSFDDAACAVSLDGTLRTVNKRVTETGGCPLLDLVWTQNIRIHRRAKHAKVWTRDRAVPGQEALGRDGPRATEEYVAATVFECVVNAILRATKCRRQHARS